MSFRAKAEAEASAPPAPAPSTGALTPATLARQRLEDAPRTPFDHSGYACVRTFEELQTWIAAAFDAGAVCFDTETDSLDPMQANLVGLSLALAPNRACYVPFGHKSPGAEDLFGGGEAAPGQLPLRPTLDLLRPLLTAPSVMKIAQNVKYDWLVLAQHGLEVAPVQDTMLASYALDAGRQWPWHGRAFCQIFCPQADPLQRSRRPGQGFYRLRQSRPRQGHGIFRRGRRRHLTALELPAAPPRR